MTTTYRLCAALSLIICPYLYAENLPLGLPRSRPNDARSSKPELIELGRNIFFDKNLSKDGSISCSSCHQSEKAFSDGRAFAKGVANHSTTRNSPSLLNVRFNSSFFWDGRRKTLESQALDPVINPLEHGLTDEKEMIAKIKINPSYRAKISRAFAKNIKEITGPDVANALAAFERTLLSGNSPADRFMFGGNTAAISKSAQRGLTLFAGSAGCASCHRIERDSALYTDQAFHSLNIGMGKIADRLDILTAKVIEARQRSQNLDEAILDQRDLAELGRFAVTLNPADIGKFRTPSLRNVALTAPYMHDGSVATLPEAIERELYRRGDDAGRPIVLTPLEKDDLLHFLESLSGT